MPVNPCGFGMNSVFGFNSNPYFSNFNPIASLFNFNTGPQYPSLTSDLNSNNSSSSYRNNKNNNNSWMSSSFSYTPQQSSFEFTSVSSSTDFMADLFSVLTPKASKTSNTAKTQKSSTVNYNTKTNLPQFNDVEYDKEKGNLLAQKVVSGIPANRDTALCAKYTKLAIQNAGLGQYISGHAYECADILRNNSNFKEINVSGNQLSKLPAGCIIVYEKGAANYSSQYGHIEVSLGDGRAASDFINSNIRPSDNVHVFVPV